MQLVWWVTHAFLFVTQSLCVIFEKWNGICCKPFFIFYISYAQRICFIGLGEWRAAILATDWERASQITEYTWKARILCLGAVIYVQLFCLIIDDYYYIFVGIVWGFFDIAEGWKEYFSLSLLHSESLSTRGAIQAVMECLTETAICSQLASRDLFGQWAQPSPRQTAAAFLGRGARSTAGPCRGSRSPSGSGSRTNTPLCPAHNSAGSTRKKKKKKAVSLHSALGWDPKKYWKAGKQGGNAVEL